MDDNVGLHHLRIGWKHPSKPGAWADRTSLRRNRPYNNALSPHYDTIDPSPPPYDDKDSGATEHGRQMREFRFWESLQDPDRLALQEQAALDADRAEEDIRYRIEQGDWEDDTSSVSSETSSLEDLFEALEGFNALRRRGHRTSSFSFMTPSARTFPIIRASESLLRRPRNTVSGEMLTVPGQSFRSSSMLGDLDEQHRRVLWDTIFAPDFPVYHALAGIHTRRPPHSRYVVPATTLRSSLRLSRQEGLPTPTRHLRVSFADDSVANTSSEVRETMSGMLYRLSRYMSSMADGLSTLVNSISARSIIALRSAFGRSSEHLTQYVNSQEVLRHIGNSHRLSGTALARVGLLASLISGAGSVSSYLHSVINPSRQALGYRTGRNEEGSVRFSLHPDNYTEV